MTAEQYAWILREVRGVIVSLWELKLRDPRLYALATHREIIKQLHADGFQECWVPSFGRYEVTRVDIHAETTTENANNNTE